MTEFVPELEALPAREISDDELVSFDHEGQPDFPAVVDRILNCNKPVPLTFVVFDVPANPARHLPENAGAMPRRRDNKRRPQLQPRP
jgi:ATP-dependent DNA ligase